jgi:hypothetical protein
MRTCLIFLSAVLVGLVPACTGSDGSNNDAPNPFLEDQSNLGKADTGYQNPDGIEVEVDLEADITAPAYRIHDAPADLGQFALTYLRKRGEFYLESLAEDSSSGRRVEWLVDGAWITDEASRALSATQLTHFRIRGVNAVLLHAASNGVTEGTGFTAKVPTNPYTIMTEAGDTCADPDDHMSLDASIYWYLWNPERSGCTATTQDMTLTVSRMFRSEAATYLEYDQLLADQKVTTVVLFGQIGDDPLTDSDPGMRAFKQMATWLKQASFTEVTPAPVGKRFSKVVGGITFEIDLYSPYDFSGLGDNAHFANFQKALSEHEIVAYDGHSMLGASDFWSRPTYPDFYQIFLYGGCLGYEYYVHPILEGKAGWGKLDMVSSVVEVSANANYFAAPFLSKLMWAVQNGNAASWKDYLIAIRNKVGDSTFGASGVRDNCYTPTGSRCVETPDPVTSHRYESATALAIPDDDAAGVTSVIAVPDALTAATVTVELDITHTWIGDLHIELTHGGVTAVLWDQAGGSTHDLKQTFTPAQFAGAAAQGDWTLKVVDTAGQDTGTLNAWAVVIQTP